MAKKPKSTKKSRFGNPAKASADAAARSAARPSADARLDRAMTALSSGFVDWLEAQSRPDKSIDVSLAILDDFFDMYRIIEPNAVPTALVPAAVQEVMEVTGHANPLGVLTLRSGVHDYVDYLSNAALWTGTSPDLDAVLAELQKTGPAEMNDGADPTTGVGGDDYDYLDYEEVALADYEFAEIYLPELSLRDSVETMKSSPLWRNTAALLEWIGEGRELTEHGTLLDQAGAAAALVHTDIGKLAGAANFTTAQDHGAARFALYWEILDTAGLITIGETHVRPSPKEASLTDEADMLLIMRDLIGHFIFLVTLDGSEEGILEDWHVDMADWLTQAASVAPPESDLLIQALEEPNTVHPDLLSIAQNIAQWAEEGLVTVGEFVEVPATWRADVFDMLKDHFPVHVSGPGAAQQH